MSEWKSKFEMESRGLEAAIAIAVEAHSGQRDKSGVPYIMHPLRIMQSVVGMVAQQAAVLHDVVEDTSVGFEDLEKRGVSPEAIEAVRCLTHDTNISYADYVCALKGNAIAKGVKLADLNDNYRLDRVAYRAEHHKKDAHRIQKYILTRQFLCDEIDEGEYRSRVKEFE